MLIYQQGALLVLDARYGNTYTHGHYGLCYVLPPIGGILHGGMGDPMQRNTDPLPYGLTWHVPTIWYLWPEWKTTPIGVVGDPFQFPYSILAPFPVSSSILHTISP